MIICLSIQQFLLICLSRMRVSSICFLIIIILLLLRLLLIFILLLLLLRLERSFRQLFFSAQLEPNTTVSVTATPTYLRFMHRAYISSTLNPKP